MFLTAVHQIKNLQSVSNVYIVIVIAINVCSIFKNCADRKLSGRR